MTDGTLQTPASPAGDTGGGSASARPGAPRDGGSLLARFTWWLVALAVVVIAGLIILISHTRPGYDPYGWLDWGYQTLHGTLNLGGAPSWKPFTFIFTVPMSIFGHYALWLWMLFSVSVSLAGAVFGGRIAYRVVRAESDRAWPAIVAAIIGGAGILGIQQSGGASLGDSPYLHFVLSVQSDPMLVTVCLAAIDCFLGKHYRWAYWLAILASLGRPEVWPFVFLFTIWAWRMIPQMRWMLYTGPVIVAFFWFGIPTITNDRPNIAGQLALRSPRECTTNKIFCTAQRFREEDVIPLELAALFVLLLAAIRRNWTALVLCGCVMLWVVIEIAFALHGFPGVPRYLFEASGLAAVLGGIGIGWLLLDASKIHRRFPHWAGIPVAVVLVGTMIPSAVSQARLEHKDIRHEQARTKEINRLSATINALGAKRIQTCGRPVVNVEYVSIMGWYLHRNTGTIGYRPAVEVWDRRYPLVLFTAFPNGWAAQTVRTPKRLKATCAGLNAFFVPTAGHPGGTLVPHAPLPLPPKPPKTANRRARH